MSSIAPFNTLNKGEREISKKEVAAFLDTYFYFIIDTIVNQDLPFFEVFKKSKNKEYKLDDDFFWRNEIRNCSYFTEYDNMLQIVKFFALNKFFSYNVDSNLFKINDIGNEMVDDKYFLPDSNKFNKTKTINFIRNALNHNDKESFQLYRLIQKQNDPKIYVEIYLRVPNFHIMVTIDELIDLLKPVLKSKSLYAYLYYDKNGNIINNPIDIINHIDEDIYYEINHAYDFDDNDIVNGILETSNNEFKKKIKFTKEQKEGIKREYELRKTNDNLLDSIFISRIVEETIPFGMTKVKGFLDDINNFLPFIYNYDKTYNDYKKLYSRLYYLSKEKAFESFDNIYYSNNVESRFLRSLVLFCSYILDSVINENETIEVEGKTIDKTVPRDSLVHGTYSTYYSKDKFKIGLFDYEHKDRRNRTDNNKIMENYNLEEFDGINLYKELFEFIKPKEYPLQLDFILDKQNFKGFKYTFKEKNTIYYVNAEFNNDIPAFLGLKDINGNVEFMEETDFDLLKEKINNIDFNKLDIVFDQEMKEFILKIPDISKESTKRFKKLFEEDNVNIYNYYGPIQNEINELSSICQKHPFIPTVSEEKIGGNYIPIFHY